MKAHVVFHSFHVSVIVEAVNSQKGVNMTGLRERILKAPSVENINTLLTEGEKYEYASPRTRNAWGHAAARRARELTKEDVKIKVIEKKAEPPKPDRKLAKHKKRQHNK